MFNISSTAVTIALAGTSTYKNYTNLTSSSLNNGISFTKSSRGDYLTVLKKGIYMVQFSSSISGKNANTYGLALGVNGRSTEDTVKTCYTHFDGTGVHSTQGYQCAIMLNASTRLTAMIEDTTGAPDNPTWLSANMLVSWLGHYR